MKPDPAPVVPPPALPPGWEEIWRSLKAEDRRARNRGELARQLGVSTHTLQRLLGDGAVPDFRKASVRQRRAWARTVARLARRLGADPGAWIRRAGIPLDEGVESAIAGEAGGPFREEARPAAAPGAYDLIHTLRRRIREGGAIEIGVVGRPLIGEPLPGRTASLLAELGRRAVACVDPGWDAAVRTGSPADLGAGLAEGRGRPAAVLGLFDSARARARGVDVLALPGWRSTLDAVIAGGPPGTEPPPGPVTRFLAREDDPGITLLRAHRGLEASRLVASRLSSLEDLADELESLARREAGGSVAFVADAGSCAAVRAQLRNRIGLRPGDDLFPDPIHLRYGLALPAAAGAWGHALAHAWNDELFGLARNETALLYGDQLLGAALRAEEVGRTPARPASWLAIEPFEAADEEFRRIAARRLLAGLLGTNEAMGARGPAPPEAAWEKLVTTAHAVLLAPWRETYDRLAWASKRELFAGTPAASRPLHGHCQSCSTSLREYPGPAEEYCTFCSDERGQLRPR